MEHTGPARGGEDPVVRRLVNEAGVPELLVPGVYGADGSGFRGITAVCGSSRATAATLQAAREKLVLYLMPPGIPPLAEDLENYLEAGCTGIVLHEGTLSPEARRRLADLARQKSASLVLLPNGYRWRSLLTAAEQLSDGGLQEATNQVLAGLIGTAGDLNTLTDGISTLFNSPIVTTDLDFRLLSYSASSGPVDQPRLDTILRRQSPSHVVEALRRSGVIAAIWETPEPKSVPSLPEYSLRPRIASGLFKGRHLMGYLWAIDEDGELGSADLAALTHGTTAIAAMAGTPGRSAHEHRESVLHFLWELLSNRWHSETLARGWARFLGLGDPHSVVAAYATWNDPPTGPKAGPELRTAQAAEAVCARWGLGYALVFPHALGIFLVPSQGMSGEDQLRRWAAALHQALAECTGTQALALGVAPKSPELTRLQEALDKASEAAQLGLRLMGGGVSFHEDLGVYRYLPNLAQQQASGPALDPALVKLEEYDREHNTDLGRTLEVFLQCAGDKGRVARTLHLHFNAVTYRIRRIETVAGVNLSDGNVRTRLDIGLKLKRLLPAGG